MDLYEVFHEELRRMYEERQAELLNAAIVGGWHDDWRYEKESKHLQREYWRTRVELKNTPRTIGGKRVWWKEEQE